jgi:hypothetical protein
MNDQLPEIPPKVYLAREAPVYKTGLYVDIGCWSVLCILVWSMGAYLHLLTRRKAAERERLGLPADLKDMSIMGQVEATTYRQALREKMRAQGMDEAKIYEQSFDDMTDFQ